MEKYGGHFSRLLDLAAGSAVALLGSVLAEFPCFRDGAEFEGRPVTFHKRAQILVMDLWCLFAGRVQRTVFQTSNKWEGEQQVKVIVDNLANFLSVFQTKPGLCPLVPGPSQPFSDIVLISAEFDRIYQFWK
jgi:hypothetical protein